MEIEFFFEQYVEIEDILLTIENSIINDYDEQLPLSISNNAISLSCNRKYYSFSYAINNYAKFCGGKLYGPQVEHLSFYENSAKNIGFIANNLFIDLSSKFTKGSLKFDEFEISSRKFQSYMEYLLFLSKEVKVLDIKSVNSYFKNYINELPKKILSNDKKYLSLL